MTEPMATKPTMTEDEGRVWIGPWRFDRLYGWWWRKYRYRGRILTRWYSIRGDG